MYPVSTVIPPFATGSPERVGMKVQCWSLFRLQETSTPERADFEATRPSIGDSYKPYGGSLQEYQSRSIMSQLFPCVAGASRTQPMNKCAVLRKTRRHRVMFRCARDDICFRIDTGLGRTKIYDFRKSATGWTVWHDSICTNSGGLRIKSKCRPHLDVNLFDPKDSQTTNIQICTRVQFLGFATGISFINVDIVSIMKIFVLCVPAGHKTGRNFGKLLPFVDIAMFNLDNGAIYVKQVTLVFGNLVNSPPASTSSLITMELELNK